MFGADQDAGPWQAGSLGKSLPGRIPPPLLSPKVTQQQLRPEEPGWLSLCLGGIPGDLWGWGGTGHSLPSRYIKGRPTDTDGVWECPHPGGSRSNPSHAYGASPTQWGQPYSDREEAGCLKDLGLGNLDPQSPREPPRTLSRIPSPQTVMSTGLAPASTAFQAHPNGVATRSPETGAWNEHH